MSNSGIVLFLVMENRETSLKKALIATALEHAKGSGQDAFALLLAAAWDAEAQGRQGQGRAHPRPGRGGSVADVRSPPGFPRGSQPQRAPPTASSASSASFVCVPEEDEAKGTEEEPLSPPPAASRANGLPIQHAPTFAALLGGSEGGEGEEVGKDGRWEDAEEKPEPEGGAASSGATGGGGKVAATTEEEKSPESPASTGKPPLRRPFSSPRHQPGGGGQEEEEGGVERERGSDSGDGGDWEEVSRPTAGRRRPAHGQAGQGTQGAVPKDNLAGRKGRPCAVGKGGAGRGQPKRNDSVPLLDLSARPDPRRVPGLQAGGERSRPVGMDRPTGTSVLATWADDPREALCLTAGKGGRSHQGGVAAAAEAIVHRVYIAATPESWQAVADVAHFSHLDDLLSDNSGAGQRRGKWDPRRNHFFHVVSFTNEALISLRRDSFPRHAGGEEFGGSLRSPSIILGGLSFAEFSEKHSYPSTFIRGDRGGLGKGRSRTVCAPTFLLPREDYRSVSTLLSDAPNIPLQVIELRGFSRLGGGAEGVYGAYEGRRAFCLRSGHFRPADLHEGCFVTVYVHSDQWPRAETWMENDPTGCFHLAGCWIYTIGGDGEERTLPEPPDGDIRKGLDGIGVRAIGECFDWGTAAHPRGGAHSFPLAAAASYDAPTGSAQRRDSLLTDLQLQLLARFEGPRGSRAPRIRVLPTRHAALLPAPDQGGGLGFLPVGGDPGGVGNGRRNPLGDSGGTLGVRLKPDEPSLTFAQVAQKTLPVRSLPVAKNGWRDFHGRLKEAPAKKLSPEKAERKKRRK